ncbi:MAG: dipeptide epimerase [Acidobacteriota bacterium]|nr:MAG: dipeptide epimerase [Acidobacteriota bacterium]
MWKYIIQRLELHHPFRISRGVSHFRETIRVSVEADGRTGYGEAAPNPRYGESIDGVLAALDTLNADAFQPDSLRSVLMSLPQLFPQSPSARAAVDIALHDWWAQSLDLPLYRLLGIDPARMPPTSKTIGIAAPDEMARRASESAEFACLKIKLGTDQDREMIEAIRKVTDQPLRVDANEGWLNREEAIRQIEWLAGVGVELVEQPMPAARIEDSAWLKQRSPLPLIADEAVTNPSSVSDIPEGYHGINIKLMKCGGLFAGLDLLTRARTAGLQVMIGCMVETSCGIAAAAQIAPLTDFVDLDSNLLISNDPFEGHPLIDGTIRLNNRPGLGVRLIERGVEPLR